MFDIDENDIPRNMNQETDQERTDDIINHTNCYENMYNNHKTVYIPQNLEDEENENLGLENLSGMLLMRYFRSYSINC